MVCKSIIDKFTSSTATLANCPIKFVGAAVDKLGRPIQAPTLANCPKNHELIGAAFDKLESPIQAPSSYFKIDCKSIIDMQIPIASKVQDYVRGITDQDVLIRIKSTSTLANCIQNHKLIVAAVDKLDSAIQDQVDAPTRGIIATLKDQLTLMRRQVEYCTVVGADKTFLKSPEEPRGEDLYQSWEEIQHNHTRLRQNFRIIGDELAAILGT
eukprot:Gb_12750 [translate_table: standard]